MNGVTRHLIGIGECMVELSQAPGGLFRQGFAGDVVNTLWYARWALGPDWKTTFHTGLGTDRTSCEMAAFLSSGGISTDSSVVLPDRGPGLYMIHLDGAERSFAYWREASAARALATDAIRLHAALANSDAVYLSGITLAILPTDDLERLLSALAVCRDNGSWIAFDPNIRSVMWSDPVHMRETLMRCAALADVILPSFEDEAGAFGDVSPSATAARYRVRDDQIVVVKVGSGPVLLRDGNGETEIPTGLVRDVVDTTGAGDSFNGAFIAEWLTSGDARRAVGYGQRTAAEVIRHHGALLPR